MENRLQHHLSLRLLLPLKKFASARPVFYESKTEAVSVGKHVIFCEKNGRMERILVV